MTTQLSTKTRKMIRAAAGESGTNCPIVVVDGAAPPRPAGERAHYETRGGEWIRHPNAYGKFGRSNMVYCSSTRRIEVGRDWLWLRGVHRPDDCAAGRLTAACAA